MILPHFSTDVEITLRLANERLNVASLDCEQIIVRGDGPCVSVCGRWAELTMVLDGEESFSELVKIVDVDGNRLTYDPEVPSFP